MYKPNRALDGQVDFDCWSIFEVRTVNEMENSRIWLAVSETQTLSWVPELGAWVGCLNEVPVKARVINFFARPKAQVNSRRSLNGLVGNVQIAKITILISFSPQFGGHHVCTERRAIRLECKSEQCLLSSKLIRAQAIIRSEMALLSNIYFLNILVKFNW